MLLGAVLALLLAATALTATRHLLDDKDRTYLSTDRWPQRGQGAYVLGNGRPAVSPQEQPVPIASVTKVMTAYLVLKHYPLHAGNSGHRFVVGSKRCHRHQDNAPMFDARPPTTACLLDRSPDSLAPNGPAP